jgi:hypothetical protein
MHLFDPQNIQTDNDFCKFKEHHENNFDETPREFDMFSSI